MSEITFLKCAIFILFFLLSVCAYGIGEMWKIVEKLEEDIDSLGERSTELETDMNILCDHIGVDYYKDIKGKSDWYLSDIREG